MLCTASNAVAIKVILTLPLILIELVTKADEFKAAVLLLIHTFLANPIPWSLLTFIVKFLGKLPVPLS